MVRRLIDEKLLTRPDQMRCLIGLTKTFVRGLLKDSIMSTRFSLPGKGLARKTHLKILSNMRPANIGLSVNSLTLYLLALTTWY